MTVSELIEQLQEFVDLGMGDAEVFKEANKYCEDDLVEDVKFVIGEKVERFKDSEKPTYTSIFKYNLCAVTEENIEDGERFVILN